MHNILHMTLFEEFGIGFFLAKELRKSIIYRNFLIL